MYKRQALTAVLAATIVYGVFYSKITKNVQMLGPVSYTHLDVYKRQLWFCTNNTKDVYKDMLENPEIEISVSSPSYAWIRLHGKAVFENNMAVKEMCIANPIVKGQYQTADNPIFEVFYLENPHGVIADFSGNPPYEF